MKLAIFPVGSLTLMINLVTAYVEGTHGSAKSALDFLRALLVHREHVFVLCPQTTVVEQTVCNRPASEPIWLSQPGSIRRRVTPERWFSRIPRELSQQMMCSVFSKRAPVIVNGWASFEYWKRHSHQFCGKRAIVVRESARHFDFVGEQTNRQEMVNAFSSFDTLIFVSDHGRQEWLDVPQLQHKQAFVLPNCCDEEAVKALQQVSRKELRQRLGIPADQFLVVFAGSVIERKGADLLLKIVPDLAKAIPGVNVVFVGGVAGRWGQDRVDEIQKIENARWVGVQPSALEHIYAADVLAFPTRAEAMPRVVLEAMALGTAVVASSVDGIPELVVDKATGILIPPDDEQALLSGIVKLARDPNLRASYAAAGKARYEECFSRRHQVERLAAILPSL